LGVGCEEDGVGTAEVVNPGGVGEVGFVQAGRSAYVPGSKGSSSQLTDRLWNR
jgi:hypothetical protein